MRVTHMGSIAFSGEHHPRVPALRSVAQIGALAVADDVPIALDFDSYYRSDYRSLVGLAVVLTGSRNLAEDLCQDALTEAHRRWDVVQHYDDPGAWVRRVLVNKSRSRFRRITTEAKVLARLGGRRSDTTPSVGNEAAGDVWAAIRALPARQAQSVALFYWEDRPISEIAIILECGEETVKTHLKRGRAALTESLGAYDPRTADVGRSGDPVGRAEGDAS